MNSSFGQIHYKSGIKKEIFRSSALYSLIVVAVFGIFLSFTLYHSEISKALAVIKKTNHAVFFFVEGFFKEISNTVEVLHDNREIRTAALKAAKDHQRILDLYRSVSRANNNITYIYSGYENGLLLINDYTPPDGYDPTIRPWYQAAMDSRPLTSIGLPYQEIKTGEWLISTSRAFTGPEGIYEGVVTVDCSISRIAVLLSQHDEYETAHSFVVNRKGEIILHRDETLLNMSFPEIKEAVWKGREGKFEYTWNKAEFLAHFKRSPLTGWSIVTVVEEREVLKPIIAKVIAVVGLTALFALLLGIVQSTLLGRSFSRPLFELSKKMRKIIAGEEDSDSSDYSYPDNEIGMMAKEIGQLTEHELYKKNSELHESEARYRSLFENAVEGFFQTTPDGRILSANPYIARLFGFESPLEFMEYFTDIGKQHYADPKDRENFKKIVETEGTVNGFETRLLKKDGTPIWASLNARAVRDEDGRTLYYEGTLDDVTESKKTEEELLESNERLRMVMNSIDAFIYIADMQTHELLFVNKYGLDAWGADIIGQKCWKAFQSLDGPCPFCTNDKLLTKDGRTAGVYQWEFQNRLNGRWYDCRDSAIRWTDGRMVRMEIATDITERKRTEEALRESENRIQSVFRSAPIGIGVVIDRVIQQCNRQMIRMLGYSEEELAGQNARILYPGDEEYEFVGREKYAQISRYGTGTVETLWRRKDGTVIDVLLSSTPIDLNDLSKGVTFTALDITERKRAEEEREKLQAQFNQAQKMESIGRLAGGIAHDFNNMLGVILGNTELALKNVDSSSPANARLQDIRKAAERSTVLTRQLLAFARKQTYAPKVIDLNETVKGMLKMLRQLIGEDIDLAWIPVKNPWPVKADPSQIDQILANLCVNARDAIGNVPGSVTIETGTIEFDEDYCAMHTGFIPGDYVMLAVSDNGCGMNRETLDKLFEPFFTTKEIGKGTGLGLATIYGIVKQNNGFINVYSEPGQGTVFRIYLPRHAAGSYKIPEKGFEKPAPSGNETILLVEDEAMILDVAMTMLEELGYTVLAAHTPGEAIRLAREHAGDIHLLMTDVIMPEMNGRELAKNLLALYPELNCLYMSGYTANVIAHHGVLDEGTHFIQKPFSMKDLAESVREALK